MALSPELRATGTSSDRLGPPLATAFGLLLALAMLFGRLPYRGLRHDGVLYMGQALAHLHPAWAASDLFFAHGSQDRYSVFSTCVAWLLQRVDAAAVDMTLLCCAWGIWIIALYALAREFAPRERWLAVLAVIVVSHFYGTTRIFSFMEPFVTARTWAEPVALMALVFLLRGWLVAAALAFIAAMLLHPLVTLPVGAAALVYLILLDRRWAALLLLGVPVLGLAIAGVAPFSALLTTYDTEWFLATIWANNIVFLSLWHPTDFFVLLINMAVVWLASHGRTTQIARLGRAVLVTTPILCLVSFLGADLMHNVLITQLQLWRICWILNLLAWLSLPTVLAREWQKGPNGRLAAVALFVAAFAMDAWLPTGWALVCWAAMTLLLSARKVEIKPSVINLATAATGVVALVLTALQWQSAVGQLAMHAQGMAIARALSIPFTLPAITLPLAFGLVLAWSRGGMVRAAASVFAAGLFVIAVTQWDQRSAWSRYLESAPVGAHPFDAFVPPGAQVYWHEDPAATWILLQRPNFISTTQVSGLLFNRDTALTAVERREALMSVMENQALCSSMESAGAVALDRSICMLPREKFLKFCSVKPAPADFLVSATDFGTGVVARWSFAPGNGLPPVSYALYDCRKIR